MRGDAAEQLRVGVVAPEQRLAQATRLRARAPALGGAQVQVHEQVRHVEGRVAGGERVEVEDPDRPVYGQ